MSTEPEAAVEHPSAPSPPSSAAGAPTEPSAAPAPGPGTHGAAASSPPGAPAAGRSSSPARPAPHRRALSLLVGWLSDRRVPTPLRAPLYGLYARATGADPSEAELAPSAYPSLGAFFARRLRAGARPIAADRSALVAPCDGTLVARGEVRSGESLWAKGRGYPVRELLAGAGEELDLEGALSWTIYLAPRDYHRVHSPAEAQLEEVRWVPGERRSVAPRLVGRRPRLLAENERAVLRLSSARGPLFLVMVGALNVGRIRVVGVEPGTTPARPLAFARGAELARFEMGSTAVLILPPGPALAASFPGPALGAGVRLGEPLARFEDDR